MADGIFQIAYDRARDRVGREAWLGLTPRQITDTIYQEIRRIDAERVLATVKLRPGGAGTGRPPRAAARAS